MIQEVFRHKFFVGLTTAFFFVAFTLNITGALSTDLFVENDKFSENFVRRQMLCEGKIYNNQLLGLTDWHAANQKPDCKTSNYSPYNSQYGLQGKFGVFLEQTLHLGSSVTIVIYQIITALAAALLFALITLWVKVKFSLTAACIFAICVSMSPMLVSFSRNLYWSLPLMVAPIVYTLYFYKPSLSRRGLSYFLAGLTFLFLLRYLCGYEYITTLTVMVVSVISYELIVNSTDRGRAIRHAILVALASAIGIFFALTIHVFSLNTQTGSTAKSIETIKSRAQERTVNSKNYTQYAYMSLNYVANDFYKTSNEYLKYEKMEKTQSIPLAVVVAYAAHLLLPVLHLPVLNGVMAGYVQSFIGFIVLLSLLYYYKDKWVERKRYRQVLALYGATCVGMVGYFSWLVFAYSHTLVHAHINGILMYLPTALFGFIIIGLYIEFLINKYIHRK